MVDADGVEDPGTGYAVADGVKDPGISIVDEDKAGIANVDGAEDPGTTDVDGNNNSHSGRQSTRRGTISNAARASLFFLCRALFLWPFLLNRRPWTPH